MRDLLNKLKRDNKLVENHQKVEPELEATKLANDDTVLFHDIDGHKVVLNLINSRDRLAEILSVKREEFVQKLSWPPLSEHDSAPIRVKEILMPADIAISEKIKNLTDLPILKYFPEDAGRYITGGVLICEYNGMRNSSVHRMMVLDEDKLAIRLVPPRHAYTIHRMAEKNGDDLPVAVVIGANPIFLYASCTRVPLGEEFEYASYLMKKPLEVFKLKNGAKVPPAEIIIEGYIKKEERAKEGPFVDITGKYDKVREEPVLEVSNIYSREDPIYQGVIPAGIEHKILMGVPYESIIYNACSNAADVKSVLLTEGGCYYFNAIVQINKQTEGDAKNVIMAAFSAHTSLKNVIVVDEDVNIYDPLEVEYAITMWVRWDRDLLMIDHVRGSSLDPTVAEDGTTSKVGIDATKSFRDI